MPSDDECEFYNITLNSLQKAFSVAYDTHEKYIENYANFVANETVEQLMEMWKLHKPNFTHPLEKHFVSRDFRDTNSIDLTHLEERSVHETLVDEMQKMNNSLVILADLYDKVIDLRQTNIEKLQHEYHNNPENLEEANRYFNNTNAHIDVVRCMLKDKLDVVENKLNITIETTSDLPEAPTKLSDKEQWLLVRELQITFHYCLNMLKFLKERHEDCQAQGN